MKKNFTLLFCLLISGIAFAQPTYQKQFGVSGNDDYDCSTMIPLEDGSVVVLGNSKYNKKYDKWDIDFVKLDKNGNVLIQKKISTDNSSGDVKGIATKDGGYILFMSQGWGDALIKLNSNAKVEWSKYYNSSLVPRMITIAIIETKSGDFILQYNLANGYLVSDKLGVMKVSSVGDLIWNTTLRLLVTDYFEYFGSSLLELSNGKIYVGGYVQTEDPFQNYHSTIIQLNKNGDYEKSLYFYSNYDVIFRLNKLYEVNRELVAYGYYAFNLNLESPEFVTGTGMSAENFYYRKYPFLKPQQIGRKCFFKNGSIVEVYRGSTNQQLGYDVVVKKYDSLNRICPDYIATEINEGISAKKFQLRKLVVNKLSDNITVSDINVYDSTLNFVQTYCSGDVPPSIKSNSFVKEKIPQISIYPNPADNILHVLNLKPDEKYQLTIMNNLGNAFKKYFVENLATYDFNLTGLKAGVYYLKVQSANTNTSYLFIKK